MTKPTKAAKPVSPAMLAALRRIADRVNDALLSFMYPHTEGEHNGQSK